MAPGPLGVGWAGSFGRELGHGVGAVRKHYLFSRGVPFLVLLFVTVSSFVV